MERSHTFALAKVNVSKIHKKSSRISFRNTIACKQAIVEISRAIVSNDTITPSDLLLFTSKQS